MLQRLVDLREGEARPVLRATAILGLVVAAHTLLETARDTLFLSKLPANRLTWVYAMLAVLSLLASSVAGRFAAAFGRRAALVFSLALSAFTAVLFYLRAPTPAAVFALYVSSGVLVTVLTIQFWMFLAELFTVAEGKRLFGPIASGGVLGAVVGASLAAAMLQRLPVSALLLLAAALFLGAAALVTGARSADLPQGNAAPRGPFAWLTDASAIAKDRYVLLLGVLTAIGTATVLVADYLFKSAAAAHFEPARLGSFFAMFYAANNALALIVQLFVTAALVRRLGVPGAATVLPIALAGSGVVAALGGGFFVALLAKGADGTLRHSLHRVTSELLLLPVAPAQRARAKPFLDTVFARGTQALTAGLILVLAASRHATPKELAALLGVLASGWVVLAWRVRQPYVDLFRQALASGSLDVQRSGELDLASVETLMQSLSSHDDDRVLAAIEILAESKHAGILPALILAHESPPILQRALAVLSRGKRRDWTTRAERLLGHESALVRAAVVRALAATGHEDAARRGLDDESGTVRAYAAFFSSHGQGAPLADPRVGRVLAASDAHAVEGRHALLGIIGQEGDASWRGVVRAIVDAEGEDPATVAEAAAAIARVQDLELVPYLVAHLPVRPARAAVRDALGLLGAPAFEALATTLSDPNGDLAVRLQVPKVLAGFHDQRAVDVLTARFVDEPLGALRYKILRALGRLDREAREGASKAGRVKLDRAVFRAAAERNLVEHFRLLALDVAFASHGDRTAVGTVLATLLRDKIDQSLERAFRCLQLAHRNENLQRVHAAVSRGDSRARSNAMELLDALPGSSAETRGLLRVIADDLAATERVRRARDVLRLSAPAAEDPAATVQLLLADADELVAALAAYHVLELGSVALAPLARDTLTARPALQNLGVIPVGLAHV